MKKHKPQQLVALLRQIELKFKRVARSGATLSLTQTRGVAGFVPYSTPKRASLARMPQCAFFHQVKLCGGGGEGSKIQERVI